MGKKKAGRKKKGGNTSSARHRPSAPVVGVGKQEEEKSPRPKPTPAVVPVPVIHTVEEIKCLSPVDHIWCLNCYFFEDTQWIQIAADGRKDFLQNSKFLICYACKQKSVSLDGKEIVQALFRAMADPIAMMDPIHFCELSEFEIDFTDIHNNPLLLEYLKPHRPRFILLTESLKSVFPTVKAQLELCGVPVRMGSTTSLTEARATIKIPVDSAGTYCEAFRRGRPTAAIVVDMLPLVKEETWRVVYSKRVDERPGRDGSVLLEIVHVKESGIVMVGKGFTALSCIPETILATMLDPVEAPEDGPDRNNIKKGSPRRPGRIILTGSLCEQKELIKEAFFMSEVQVLLAGVDSGSCCNDSCTQVHLSTMELQFCACEEEDYCSKACQKAQWKKHKRRCKWYAEKKTKMNDYKKK